MATQIHVTVQPADGDYTSLEAALDGNEQNLVTNNKYLDIEITGDWSGGADTTAVTINNYTVDSTHYINIYTTGDALHDGTSGASTAYVLQCSSSPFIDYFVSYVYLTGLTFKGSNGDYIALSMTRTAFAGEKVNRCIFYQLKPNAGGVVNTNNTGSLLLTNSIFIYCDRSVYASTGTQNSNCLVYNCTSRSDLQAYGFLRCVCKNCYSGNTSTEDFFSLESSSDYNVSSDTSASDEATNAVDSQTSYTNYFVDITNDLHIKDTSSNLWGLSGTNFSGTFTDDIDGDTRSNWDIGADEYEGEGSSPSPSPSTSVSSSPSSSVSSSPSSSTSASPSAGWESYTKGDYDVLPADDTDLENAFDDQDYIDVNDKDDVRVAQTATDEYAIFLFKDYVGNNTSCNLEWEGQTNCPPSLSTVYLQIYNQNTTTWENVDSDNTSNEDTDFTLSGNIADLSDYKTGNLTISCRVYQQDV